jgi:hypothetical protein
MSHPFHIDNEARASKRHARNIKLGIACAVALLIVAVGYSALIALG